ncbi:hypothetical protein [Ornithinibacillus halophilus]|uniref:Uncharacterized protein n=1 Tax=Ornithinibacillus halophilus TaxID=930117 RepID=A0A1M5JLW8_9BACI|nr:hypothetical protein [Ornithinibacillus halophilus]SHG41521.1 hypothetical protein SAMN05216225_10321 [Ornithinibacillus halophilus]
MKKYTILLLTLLLFVFMFNVFSTKDRNVQLVTTIEELETDMNEQFLLFEKKLKQKEDRIQYLEDQIYEKDSLMYEFISKLNLNNYDVAAIMDRVENLPRQFGPDDHVATKN